MADQKPKPGDRDADAEAAPAGDDLYVYGDIAVAAAVVLVGLSLADLNYNDFG